ncbi:MAG: STAS domain-containing protein [Phycisphaerae bacterium]
MNVEFEQKSQYKLAKINGELNTETAPDFAETMLEHALGSDARLIIDLSALRSIDSTGLSVLINLGVRSRMSQGRLILSSPTLMVQGVLEVSRLDQFFEICETFEEAEAKILAD